MSDAYVTTDRLVSADSNVYDRGLDTAIALSVVGFTLGLVTLVNLVSPGASGGSLTTAMGTLLAVVLGGIGTVGLASSTNVVPVTSQRVRGIGLGLVVSTVALTALAATLPVTMATLLGTVLLAEALAITVAGVTSRLEIVDTEPNMSAGLLSGVALGAIGGVLASEHGERGGADGDGHRGRDDGPTRVARSFVGVVASGGVGERVVGALGGGAVGGHGRSRTCSGGAR